MSRPCGSSHELPWGLPQTGQSNPALHAPLTLPPGGVAGVEAWVLVVFSPWASPSQGRSWAQSKWRAHLRRGVGAMVLDLRHCGDGVGCMTAATKVGQITVVRRNEAHFHALKGRAEEYWQGTVPTLLPAPGGVLAGGHTASLPQLGHWQGAECTAAAGSGSGRCGKLCHGGGACCGVGWGTGSLYFGGVQCTIWQHPPAPPASCLQDVETLGQHPPRSPPPSMGGGGGAVNLNVSALQRNAVHR